MISIVNTTVSAKPSLFNQMKIGVRVGLSFFVILVIFFVAAFFSLDTFNQSETSFINYSKVSSEAVVILDIDRQVSELQRVILAYSNTGSHGIINRAKNSHQVLLNSLNKIQDSIANEKSLELLNNMTNKLASYGDYIDVLIESREQRDRIIDETLKPLANDSTSIIVELKKNAEIEDDADTLEKINLINEFLFRARIDVITFLGNRKYSFQESSKEFLRLAKENTKELNQPGVSSVLLISLAQKLEENISAYENAYYQAIQATRDYLYLVNVVMAGEASEFTTLSTTLKESTLSTLELLTDSTKERFDDARKTTSYVTSGAVATGILLAFFISQSLSRPIREISNTFEKLVQNKHDTEIPGLNRGDEIGQLANAANVFRQMNEQTNKILGESQALADKLQLNRNQLKERTISLQKSNEELDNFAYIASHDLKSPLRGIDNLCKWIKEDCSDILPEESRSHLDKMQQRVNRMENLLTDLLSYSRIGRDNTPVEKIDTVELVRSVIELADIPNKFIIKVSDNLPTISTQVLPLQQVFLNLITNAVKYSNREDGLVIVTSKRLSHNFVEFSMSDNGPGIDPKFHKLIFQMFQTLQPRDEIESSGIGLAIIKKIIEGQGGEINVESVLGGGCVFKFSWPLNATMNSKVA